jgi:hypothetical protein
MRLSTLLITFCAGALIGAAAVIAVAWLKVYPVVAEERFSYGYELGGLAMQANLGSKIPGLFGSDVDPHEPMTPFFERTKGEQVVVVTRNGVKTLRLYRDASKATPDQ